MRFKKVERSHFGGCHQAKLENGGCYESLCAMILDSREPIRFEGARWKAVRLGLRLAKSWLGVGLIARFYLIWCLIGLLLCFVFIPFALLGKMDVFNQVMNPVALYGYLLPMALLAAATWAVRLFSRLLWCGIPEPLTATFLAFASVAGRLSVLFALGHMWISGGPFGKGLLLPGTIACSGIAWLGLVADLGFIRSLRRDFIAAPDPALTSVKLDHAAEEATESKGVTDRSKKAVFTRDLGEWFKERFPRAYQVVTWILLPVAYVAVSSLADDGNPQAIPNAILRLAVIAPVILQIFWIPGDGIDELICALSPNPPQKSPDPA